jgi:hypothetical protein
MRSIQQQRDCNAFAIALHGLRTVSLVGVGLVLHGVLYLIRGALTNHLMRLPGR